MNPEPLNHFLYIYSNQSQRYVYVSDSSGND
jgi:hypothetical protein